MFFKKITNAIDLLNIRIISMFDIYLSLCFTKCDIKGPLLQVLTKSLGNLQVELVTIFRVIYHVLVDLMGTKFCKQVNCQSKLKPKDALNTLNLSHISLLVKLHTSWGTLNSSNMRVYSTSDTMRIFSEMNHNTALQKTFEIHN